jgi:23S rRNA pseudouridine955/2504/2580 synthase
VVDDRRAGVRLLDLLHRELPDVHPLDLRATLGDGAVRVNGEVRVADRALRAGDVVELLAVPRPRPRGAASVAATTELQVLFESAHALVVAKPAGLPTVPDRSGAQRGVHGLLGALRPDADLRIVHRLDRDTSGCLLLAKGVDAARHFDREFRGGRVHKTYVAVVHGVPPRPQFAIDAWLGADRRRPGKVVASATQQPGFRAAHTEVTCRATFARHALLELRPTTGRGHQLRVHLQSVGHPIAGDLDYGGEPLLLSRWKPGYKLRPGTSERPLTPRMFLHAAHVTCADVDGSTIDVEAPLPDDLARALHQLETHGKRGGVPCG